MSKRISLSELITFVAEKQGTTKKDAEFFLRELVALISEQVEKDDPVKIKDLGTFKLIKVSSRKSVDVNTGQTTEIPAHYKLSFTPDKHLKDAVNRPFAHFENVLIDDEDVRFDDLETDSVGNRQEEAVSPIENESAKEESVLPEEDVIKVMLEKERKPVLQSRQERKIDREQEKDNESAFSLSKSKKKDFLTEKGIMILLVLLLVSIVGVLCYMLYNNLLEDKKAEVPYDLNNQDVLIYDDNDSINTGSRRQDTLKADSLHTSAKISADKQEISTQPVVTGNVEETANADSEKAGEEESFLAPKPQTKQVENEDLPTKPAESTKTIKSSLTDPTTITLTSGTTLRSLGMDYYGDRAFWVYIYEENIDVINDPNNIPLGTLLIIPARNKYGIDAKNSVSVQKAKDIEAEMYQSMD